ncbi:MAG TPA: hypothetical protein VMP01_26135 [Pirellulaceae bacterium]|nr:hypothetical protein [Pirellulaceae bacterium]
MSIAHLMLWMLGTGISLTYSRAKLVWFEPARSQLDNIIDAEALATWQQAVAVVICPFAGAAVAALLATGWQLARRKPIPCSQPGHWLLLVAGVAFLNNVTDAVMRYLTLRALLAEQDYSLLTSLRIGLLAIINLGVAALFFVAWRFTLGPKRWRFYFACGAMIYGLAAPLTLAIFAIGLTELPTEPLMVLAAIIFLPLAIALVISFVWSVAKDIWSKERRDLLHWIGVIVVIGTAVVTVADRIVPIAFLRMLNK